MTLHPRVTVLAAVLGLAMAGAQAKPDALPMQPYGKLQLEGVEKAKPTRDGERTNNVSQARPAGSGAGARTNTTSWDRHAVKPAPGGGPGKVWVNTQARVYHCPDDPLYGRTQKGAYMTEAKARSTGARPLMDRTCS